MKKLVIIGGGAAGLMAAMEATSVLEMRGILGAPTSKRDGNTVEVVVMEAGDRVGRSILATGNGRCNFSNAAIRAQLYRNAEFVSKTLNCAENPFGKELNHCGVHETFSQRGLVWREESEGRLYPLANKASSVLDVLHFAVERAGVKEKCGHLAVRVSCSEKHGNRFCIQSKDGSREYADAVIVAVGGGVSQKLFLPSQLTRVQEYPVLGPLRTDVSAIRSLNNIRVRGSVSLFDARGVLKAEEEGEILFRDYGLSGIAIFNLSRFACEGDELRLDFLPHLSPDTILEALKVRLDLLTSCYGQISGESLLQGMLLPGVSQVVLKEASIRLKAPIGEAGLRSLAGVLKGLPLTVRGIGDARQCQVTRGGIAVDCVNPVTMEALAIPGLYIAGEALDVDAPCGGYNLHWAWASGMVAGRSAAAAIVSSMNLSEGISHARTL